jgi:menaquinone-dependent protoporphyrinogen IX oxidase
LRDEFNQDVDVFDLKKERKKVKLENYQYIIIGSSIAMGKWTSQAKRFLKNKFDNKLVFVYVCSGEAGEALQANDESKFAEAKRKYLETVLADS